MLTCFPSLPAIALCSLLLSTASAAAQADEPAASSGYWQAINQAVGEYGEGQFERAASSFERAQKLWPNARPLRGLGKVAFAQHRFVAAIDYFQRALESNVHPLDATMKREVEELRVHAQSALADVDVELEPKHADITIDDRPASVSPDKPLRLDPGDHQILARAQGYISERRNFTLQPGQHTTWIFHLQPDQPDIERLTPRDAANTLQLTAAAPQLQDAHPEWLLPVGGTLAVAGLGVAGGALAFAVTHFEDSSKVLGVSHDKDPNRYNQRWDESRTRMFWWSGAAAGLLSLGAGALADYIPREQRYWLTPTLAAAGGALLATGLSLYGANRAAAASGGPLQSRIAPADRADTGTLLAMLSAPLLTLPLMHAVTWLTGDK